MIEVSDLSCERDDRVLFNSLSFQVNAGDVLQVQGANGSGKTTLLRILCGLNNQFEGEISWRGEPRASVRAGFYAESFYLGHMPAIKKNLTPYENLQWFCATQGRGGHNEIKSALKEFNLQGYDDFPTHLMSAGQQRRISLARLALSPARLWILDEPFTALDRAGVESLEFYLSRHAEEGGAVILTTHHALKMPCAVRVVNLDEETVKQDKRPKTQGEGKEEREYE